MHGTEMVGFFFAKELYKQDSSKKRGEFVERFGIRGVDRQAACQVCIPKRTYNVNIVACQGTPVATL